MQVTIYLAMALESCGAIDKVAEGEYIARDYETFWKTLKRISQ